MTGVLYASIYLWLSDMLVILEALYYTALKSAKF